MNLSITDADRKQINPSITLIPSKLGVGFEGFLQFPKSLYLHELPSLLKHLAGNKNVEDIGLERNVRISHGIYNIPIRQREFKGYIVGKDNRECQFTLGLDNHTFPKITGIVMFDQDWLVALHDDIRNYFIN